jgi:hypothetical protein
MFTHPEPAAGSECTVGIGPLPYYHRSDCNICRQRATPLTASLSDAEAMSQKVRAELELS